MHLEKNAPPKIKHKMRLKSSKMYKYQMIKACTKDLRFNPESGWPVQDVSAAWTLKTARWRSPASFFCNCFSRGDWKWCWITPKRTHWICFPPREMYPMSSFWRFKKKRWSFGVFVHYFGGHPKVMLLSFRVLKLFFLQKAFFAHRCLLLEATSRAVPETLKPPTLSTLDPQKTHKGPSKRQLSSYATIDKRSPSQDPSADRWGASILFSPQTSNLPM